MAEQIPYGVVVSFINRLASSAFREMGQIYGVMDELEKLKETVESIKAVLLDAEEKQQRSHAVKIWISRLNKVLHDADDLFDDFVTEDLRRKVDSHGKIVRESLEYIYYEWCEEVSSSASFFPSLETLEIKLCRNLKGWQKMANVNEIDIDELQHHQQHLLLPPFPCLSHLEILNCPNLIYMPPYPHLAKRLELRASCVKPLIDTVEMKMKIGESTAAQEYNEPKPNAVTTSWFWFQSPSFSPLSTLKSMLIQNIDMEALPADWMRNLTSLQHLSVQRFPSLALVFRHMQHLPAALEELQIWNMNKIEFEDANVNIFTRCQPLHCLYSLQTIGISSCSKLKAMPEWICNLPSLQHMIIRDCPDLKSLPEGMHRLTNLQTLLIRSCPLLSERCQREKGADWLKIAHIPDIYCHYHKI